RITIERCPREHVGLGTGTQLAMAVARALVAALALPWDDAAAWTLAKVLSRGARSAVGIHGFLHGGFLVEGGKAADSFAVLSPLLARCDFPASWRIVLVIPSAIQGLHGQKELDAFAKLLSSKTAATTTDALCRLVLLGILPALHEGNL